MQILRKNPIADCVAWTQQHNKMNNILFFDVQQWDPV